MVLGKVSDNMVRGNMVLDNMVEGRGMVEGLYSRVQGNTEGKVPCLIKDEEQGVSGWHTMTIQIVVLC